MDIEKAYDLWATQYDINNNKTRDLEGAAIRTLLSDITFSRCLEIGCGTGKNTEWLLKKASHITAVDLSNEMLLKAKEKIISEKVDFIQADIILPWSFSKEFYDLITFSLILEHIQDIDHVFSESYKALKKQGFMFIGELHPFKQYLGTKARFDDQTGRHVLKCYTHNISEFTEKARFHGFSLIDIKEFFDGEDAPPRILALLFKKS